MVDVSLFSALLRALRPGTRLVLVGDADQLPPWGGKCVFRPDPQQKIETVFLREVFRQAEQSAIIRNAHWVNLGESPDLKGNQGISSSSAVGRPAGGGDGAGAVQDPPAGQYAHPGGADPGADAHPEGACGTINLNRLLQEALNPGHRQAGDPVGERVFR